MGWETYKRRDELEALRLAGRVNAVFILYYKRNLDDPREAGSHEGVPEHGMHHGAEHQMLSMAGHRPAGKQDDQPGDEIALRLPATPAAHPHAAQASRPPHNAHARVLDVLGRPVLAPPVLGEGVDAAPRGDDGAVEELWGAARAEDPLLPDEEEDEQQDPVPDERGPHDEVREALPEVVVSAEAERGDPAEEHLHPAHDRHDFAD